MQRQAIYTKEDALTLTENGKDWNFHDANTQEHLHKLHPYPAKFIPQIPRKAIQNWSRKGDLIYDPFAGCGTTLFEASLMGRASIGTDNNSVAILVSRAKTAIYKPETVKAVRAFLSTLDQRLAKTKPRRALIPTNPNFRYWFSEAVLDRLSALKSLILAEAEVIQPLLMTVFSSILVRVSYQDSDTRYAKIERTVNPEDVDKSFKSKLTEVLSVLPDVPMNARGRVSLVQADARDVPFIKSGTVTLIVTSPPYLNAYDYHKYHRQRLHWIDGDVEFARDLEIGSHDEFTRPKATPSQYFCDMNACFSEWARVLKPGGRCFIVIGDAIVTKRPVHVADEFIDLLQQHGLELEERWIRELHSTKRAFNVRNSRISHEHLLLLRKAATPRTSTQNAVRRLR